MNAIFVIIKSNHFSWGALSTGKTLQKAHTHTRDLLKAFSGHSWHANRFYSAKSYEIVEIEVLGIILNIYHTLCYFVHQISTRNTSKYFESCETL